MKFGTRDGKLQRMANNNNTQQDKSCTVRWNKRAGTALGDCSGSNLVNVESFAVELVLEVVLFGIRRASFHHLK